MKLLYAVYDLIWGDLITIPLPGGTAEPMEVPISFPAGTGDFLLLAATAALVLSDVLEEKNQREFIRFYAP